MPAPDRAPVTWLALEALRDVLLGVSQENGYYTDLGLGQIVLDDSLLDESEAAADAPCTFIEARNLDPTTAGKGHANSDMEILIEYVIPRDSDTNLKLAAHCGAADLVRALTFKTSGRSGDMPAGFAALEITGARLGGETDPETNASFVIAQVTARASVTDRFPA
ncbi:hypothetical protein V3391_06515 [Luteimonas sp. SMYT11W]|uniref:Uncharacterized protein n=1 Tax=Luteimonas flava TaxID=3115822 RepID=A0ABU7WED8_9GAMM